MENTRKISKKRYIAVITIFIALPILLWILGGTYVGSMQARTPGSLYAFWLSSAHHKILAIVFPVLFLVHSILAVTYFAGSKRTRGILFSLIIIWILGIIWAFSNCMSFGHIEETGISYKSFSTYYKTEKVTWAQMDGIVPLDISYFEGRGSGLNYSFVLKIQPKDLQSPVMFYVPFSGSDKQKSLQKVLKLLHQKQFRVITNFQDDTLKKIASDPQKADLLKDIKALTEVK